MAVSVKSRKSEIPQPFLGGLSSYFFNAPLPQLHNLFIPSPLAALTLVNISSVHANSQDCTTPFLHYSQSTLGLEGREKSECNKKSSHKAALSFCYFYGHPPAIQLLL